VRSTLAASQFAADAVDLKALAKADIDAVLTGTILRADEQLRVTAQLADVPSGTVRWSQTMNAKVGDVFQLQDALTMRIVESLAVPLTARDKQTLTRDVPRSAKAYEFYLRANQLAYEVRNWTVARDLYLQCVDEDPNFAPAWARLGRIYRLVGMFYSEAGDPYARAEEAFQRALALNPELSIAHNLYTSIELETGRPRQAMLRLLERTQRRSTDPELFAGLVQACRYAGLDRPAIVAYEHAVRLDPEIRTAIGHVYLTSGEYAKAVAHDNDDPPILSILALGMMKEPDRAITKTRQQIVPGMPPLFRLFHEAMLAVLEERHEDARAIADDVLKRWRLRDPCATFYAARTFAKVGHPGAIGMLRRAIDGGFYSYSFMKRDPWLDPVRGSREFNDVLRLAESRYREAVAAFVAAGGEKLLGSPE
jgi:tetratricopeptide (TPR) repeat protein